MNWAIIIISKTLMTKISHISWGGYNKGFTVYKEVEINKVNKKLKIIKWILY